MGYWAMGYWRLDIGYWLWAKGYRRGDAAELLTLPINYNLFLKQEYGTSCLQKSRTIFSSSQKNAARCIGEQKKKKIVEKIKQARFEGVPVRCIWE